LSIGVTASAGDLVQLPGSFSVSTTGAATYSVPIEVPPGTNAMAPVLSLDYTSHAANGTMGVGWALSGIPTISRCPQTIATDGVSTKVNFNANNVNNDRFCLSGQRLILTAGTYGANNATYVTEVDNSNLVISSGTAGTGPQFFTVWTKAGQIMTFGNPSGNGGAGPAVSATNATIRSWALTRIQDVSGNYLTVVYGQPSTLSGFAYGEYYPTEIDYTANDGQNLAAYNKVTFTYATRSDIIDTYQSGAEFRTSGVMTDVMTYAGSTLVSDYKVGYGTSSAAGATGRSIVQSVTRCASATDCESPTLSGTTFTPPPCVADGNCLPPTTFLWQAGGPITNISSSWVATQNANQSTSSATLVNYKAYLGDFEGTGRESILWDPETTSGFNSGAQPIFWLSNGDGTFRVVYDATVSGSTLSGYTPQIGNFTGASQADILWVAHGTSGVPSGPIRLWLNASAVNKTTNSFANNAANFVVQTITAPSAVSGGTTRTNTGAGTPIIVDANGDGLSDIFWYQADASGRTASCSSACPTTGEFWLNNTGGSFTAYAYSSNLDGLGTWQPSFLNFKGKPYPQLVWLRADSSGRIASAYKNSAYTGAAIFGIQIDLVSAFNTASSGNTVSATEGPPTGVGSDPNFAQSVLATLTGYRPLFGDFVGDGMQGIFIDSENAYQQAVKGAAPILWCSNGDGTFRLMHGLPAVPTTSVSGAGYHPMVADFNGDGRSDILWDLETATTNTTTSGTTTTTVATIATSGYRVVWYSTGTGFTVQSDLAGQDVSFTGSYLPIVADFTGDGKADILWDDMDSSGRSQGYHVLWQTDGVEPDLMTSYTSGLGASTQITYTPMSSGKNYTRYTNAVFPESDIQNSLPLVQNVVGPNGIGGTYQTNYTYGGAKADMQGRGFKGFKYFADQDVQTNIYELTYLNHGWPYIGMPYWKVKTLLTSGQVLSQSTYNYADLVMCGVQPTTNSSAAPVTSCPTAPSPQLYYLPYLQSETDLSTDLDGVSALPTKTTVFAQPDAYGNPLSVTSLTCTSTSPCATTSSDLQFTKQVTSTYQYSVNTTSGSAAWQVGEITDSKVTSTRTASAPGTIVGATGTQLSNTLETSFAYANPTNGRITSTTKEPGQGAPYQVTNNLAYDSWGHVTSSQIIPSENPSCEGNIYPSVLCTITTTSYDSRGQFVTQVVNAEGQNSLGSIPPTYDPRFGTVITIYDANNLEFQANYDGFGRKISAINPDGSQDSWVYGTCKGTATSGTCTNSDVYPTSADGYTGLPVYFVGVYHGICPSGTACTGRLATGGSGWVTLAPHVTTYHDQVGRVIYADTPGFGGTQTRAAVEYNGQGQVSQTSQPYFYSGGTPAWSSFTYDVIGRLAQSNGPNGLTSHSFEGLTTIDENAKNQLLTTVRDGAGEILSVTDALGNVTTYTYNADSVALTVTDPMNNISSKTLDKLDRTIGTSDPDSGVKTYTYDSLGRVLQMVNTNDLSGQGATTGQQSYTTKYTYDQLNRMTSRAEAEYTSNWWYDTLVSGPQAGGPCLAAGVASGATTIGKLCQATTGQGYSRTYGYNGLDKLKTTTIIPTAGAPAYTLTTAYDTYGRPSTLTYPSVTATSSTVSYSTTLNYETTDAAAFGYQTTLTEPAASTPVPIVTVNTADAAMRPLSTTIGSNQWTTSRSWDPTSARLTGISTLSSSNGTETVVQSLSYGYDTIGNVLTRTDQRQGLTDTYTYDAVNRVQTVETTGSNTAGTPVSKAFDYDAAGNMIYRSDLGTMTYGPAGLGGVPKSYGGPHILKSMLIEATPCPSNTYYCTLSQQANNTTLRNYTLMSFNKPQSVQEGGVLFSYIYDDRHQRVMQTQTGSGVSPSTTVYVEGVSEIVYPGAGAPSGAPTTETDFIFHGGSLVGAFCSSSSASPQCSGHPTDIMYFHTDGQGSIGAVTDGLTVSEQDSYDPWGRRRQLTGADDTADGQAQSVTSVTTHGFVGEEHVQGLGLIQIGGGMWDPLTASFVSGSGMHPANPRIDGAGMIGAGALWRARGAMPGISSVPYYVIEGVSFGASAGQAMPYSGSTTTSTTTTTTVTTTTTSTAAGDQTVPNAGGSKSTNPYGNEGVHPRFHPHPVPDAILEMTQDASSADGWALGWGIVDQPDPAPKPSGAGGNTGSVSNGGTGGTQDGTPSGNDQQQPENVVANSSNTTGTPDPSPTYGQSGTPNVPNNAPPQPPSDAPDSVLEEVDIVAPRPIDASTSMMYRLFLIAEQTDWLHGHELSGHLFIGGVKPGGSLEAKGFYPKGNAPWRQSTSAFGGAGVVQDDTDSFIAALSGAPNYAIAEFNVDADTYNAAMSYMTNYQYTYNYQLLGSSCVTAAISTLDRVNLPDPFILGTFGVSPDQVYNSINAGDFHQ
jgi:YD repeat-containing protein